MMTDQCIDRLSLNKTHNDVWRADVVQRMTLTKILGIIVRLIVDIEETL